MGLNELVFGSLAVLGIVVFLFVGRFRADRSQRVGMVGGTNCDRPVPWGRIRPGHRATWP